LLKLPFSAVAHGTEFGVRKNISGIMKRWAFRKADAVVAVSEFTVGVMANAGIKARRVEVISNAADSSRFVRLEASECNSFRQRAGFGKASLLLTVGCVSERKGQEVVIRAFPQVLQKVPDAHYVMVGLPALREKLEALAKQLGVAERVHFRGKVEAEELVRWLNCCDLFVMTSRTTATGDCEGFGIAVVEAALCGKPAVVSSDSGLVEAIQNGVTGLAVPEGDESATAAAIISLMQNPGRRQTMGEAARARALREQTWETCVSHYDQILRQLVCTHPNQPHAKLSTQNSV
jgi:phosphatidylinositol alpha-1,6-mannosyltransferase